MRLQQRRTKTPRIILLLVVALWSLPSVYATDGGIESLRETGKAFSTVAKSVSPSVVFIQTESKLSNQAISTLPSPFGHGSPFDDDLFKRFFGDSFQGLPRREPLPKGHRYTTSQGSGFVINVKEGLLSDKSYIMTNNHVVQGADNIRVKFSDGREYDAEISGRDPHSDIAVIAIKAKNLPVVKPGDSSKLEVGEWVIAIGSPFGLSHSLTVGVVSAVGRSSLGINDYENFIQTDAAINPGNSGGPLVNLSGEVVGINTAIFTRSGGYMGVGLAIPINMAMDIANQLMDKGEVTRGFLGILIQTLTPELAESFELKNNQGILIAEVSEKSPAEKAGLRQGDVIVTYRDEAVTDIGSFRNQVSLTPPDQRVTLTVIRDGKRKNITAVIGNLAQDETVATGTAQSAEEIGLTVQTLSPELASQFKAKTGEGVVVTQVKPGSVAALAGIKTGTIILQVNQQAVKNASDFQQAIQQASKERRVLLLTRIDGGQRYVVMSW